MAISVELPDLEMDPEWMFETVSKCMMHGPCGPTFPNVPCMQDGRCSKGYPRSFRNETSLDENGYPLYHRQDNDLKVLVKGVELDNRWVVSYNPYLCKKFNGHINTETSISIYGVKYMFKYIYKGHDRMTVVIERVENPIDGQQVEQDEIQEYIDARYVSALEVVWRIFKMKLHGRFPAVQRLQVHLPNQQTVVFSEDADLQEVVGKSKENHIDGVVYSKQKLCKRSRYSLCQISRKMGVEQNIEEMDITSKRNQDQSCLLCTSSFWRKILFADAIERGLRSNIF